MAQGGQKLPGLPDPVLFVRGAPSCCDKCVPFGTWRVTQEHRVVLLLEPYVHNYVFCLKATLNLRSGTLRYHLPWTLQLCFF